VFLANDRCDQENLIGQLKGGVKALSMPVDNLVSNWASMVMASLAWSLKAWAALLLPEQGRWAETHRAEKRSLLRMEFRTHGPIAFVHAVNGMVGVGNVEEFVGPVVLPKGLTRVAAIEGEYSDPADSLTRGDGLLAHILSGGLEYQLHREPRVTGGSIARTGRTSPGGAEVISGLFGGESALIMFDEVFVDQREIERAPPRASPSSRSPRP
jgi:hypothetical protein